VSCIRLGGVLGLVWGLFSAVALFIKVGGKRGDGACLFAKVGNCVVEGVIVKEGNWR